MQPLLPQLRSGLKLGGIQNGGSVVYYLQYCPGRGGFSGNFRQPAAAGREFAGAAPQHSAAHLLTPAEIQIQRSRTGADRARRGFGRVFWRARAFCRYFAPGPARGRRADNMKYNVGKSDSVWQKN